MIDIHCHILPKFDDGAKDMPTTLAMARKAVADGIDTIVATPHLNEQLYPHQEIAKRVAILNHTLKKEGIDLKILPGADVSTRLDPALIKDFSINGTHYILIEFPHSHLPADAASYIFNCNAHGLTPIFTHPERNPSVVADPGRLLELMQYNVLVQITAGSLTGRFGQQSKQCAIYLLKHGAVHFIATDAHSLRKRPPILSAGVQVAAKYVGEEAAMKMVTTYPKAVVAGKPLDEEKDESA